MSRIDLTAGRPLHPDTLSPEPLKFQRLDAELTGRLEKRFFISDGVEPFSGGALGQFGGGQLPPRPADIQRQNQERRFAEAREAPHLTPVNPLFDSTVNAKLEDLERFVDARVVRYEKAFETATDPKMKAYYKDLYVAMVTDRSEFADWRSKTGLGDKEKFYNRMAKEVELEIKHNVVIITGDGEQWTPSELDSLDRGLTAAGPRLVLEGELQMMVKSKEAVGSRGRLSPSSYDSGVITFSETAMGNMGGNALHQIGLSKVPWGPFQDRLMADSGWQRVGDQNVPSLARFNHGDLTTAKDLKALGVSVPDGTDDAQVFRIGKKDGQAFILPVNLDETGPQRQVNRLAQDGPAEDFAQTYAAFRTDPATLMKDFPAKYQLMLELEQAGWI
jgi:hypothetical protein